MFSRKKDLIVYLLPFALFCALWWWLSASTRAGIQQIFVDIQAPIYVAVSDTGTFLDKAKKKLISRDELLAECERLIRMNLYLQTRIDDLSSSLPKNGERKKSILEDINDRFRFIYANVVRRDLASWSNLLVINRGERDGVQVGDGVIAGNNVVGRIKAVYRMVSVVELVSSPTFRTSACLENDNFPVIFHGSVGFGFSQYSGVAENIVTDLSTPKNKTPNKVRLVSSYLSGVFPGGLTIGYLLSPNDSQGGMFAKSAVELDENFINTLHEVVVLSPIKDE